MTSCLLLCRRCRYFSWSGLEFPAVFLGEPDRAMDLTRSKCSFNAFSSMKISEGLDLRWGLNMLIINIMEFSHT